MPNPLRRIWISYFGNLGIILRMFSKYRGHLVLLTILGFFGAILEGIGINIAIPLFSFLLNGTPPTDIISQTVSSLFSFFHVPFTFRYLLLFILGLMLLRSVSLVAFGYIRGAITADFFTDESAQLLSRTLVASWPFLAKQKLGNLHNTLTRDIQRTGSLLESISQFIQSSTGCLIYVLVAFTISPIVTLCTLGGGAGLMFFVRPFLRKGRRLGEEMSETEKGMSQFLSEHIIGIKPIKAAGVEERAYVEGKGILESLKRIYMRLALVRSLSTSFFQPFSLILVVILFITTYQSGNFNFLAFGASLYLIQKIFTYLESGQNSLHAITELIPYAQNIISFRKAIEQHVEEQEKQGKPFTFEKEIALESVNFGYDETQPILQSVSFTIRKGETVGLIGPSGAGKSSVADMVLGLLTPTAGLIRIDQTPLAEFSLREWRAHLGYVSQEVFLFNGTIEENIRFYRPNVTQEDVRMAAKNAHILDFIDGLPEGFETIVGDRGVRLSGGQRQRIALARALAGKPDILVLDEATSALDTESERHVQAAIEGLHGNVTVLVIAHRLSTVAHADRLVVLDDGRVREQGSPAELLSDPNSYYAKHHSLGNIS